ncbi:3-deoxy-manno-octulosonate cytidylyltransferase [Leptospira kmetyi]|uniref:3-deoxy-manno-octulosonate cytidylyltransferase n=1 Tax=Leptospira kmetyi TaxID=408139 RepID=A0A5F1XYK2_9LEPT|nr:3-deoxy-manno-octulosonate cytidylyltransferase [Leptospira kmetyi]AYV57226.1 3-deoxy-manno-octulosonate cytidylyltransferase [Leptospira kmetyi]TGK21411.1 3-deoxy-manno-octulosonate cytidylyltransferase [Leptospira kmetyi]TGK28338.1 3-deoxy-manno-octulosonate cytidylyltransferase [Leptospira kmetyi]TGL68294.1 3-deoxy-manno-octulosonate cytidylyltransferase [Leptospira kmetyi]
MKVIGIIPARMAASRFPGKPLFPIHGKPMVEHVYLRAKMYTKWDHLVVATCDKEIEQFCKEKGFPVVMTGDHHTRALDRVAEAMGLIGEKVADDDIVVCVQGDEPMMRPDMIDAAVAPLLADAKIPCTVLAMHIVDKSIWMNPDTVKIIHNAAGEVLYTSRAPLPYCKGEFTADLMARRIYGIFGFRSKYLTAFTEHPETRLEQLEACDSNRILDMPFAQYIAPYPNIQSFSVDSPEDIKLVEKHMLSDAIWSEYK